MKARIEILGDAASFLRSIRLSRNETGQFSGDLSKLAVSAKKSAAATVQAAVQKDARIRANIRAYRDEAAAAKHGSREQVAATNAATQAERQLSRSLATSAREARTLSRSSRGFASGVTRGAHESSGALRRMASNVAAVGVSLLAGGGLVFGVRSLVEKAIAAKAALGQLALAERSVGDQSVRTSRQAREQLETQRKLGFSELDSVASMTTLERATRSMTVARKAQLLVDNIARARHKDLATVANAVAKTYNGQVGALRRLVPSIRAGATATEAITQATKQYAGAAKEAATGAGGAQDRLTASIEATDIAIGSALTPTITRLSNTVSDWLSKAENQKRLQRDVAEGAHDLAIAGRTVVSVFRALQGPVRTVTGLLGGSRNAVRLLVLSFLAFKAAKLATGIVNVGLDVLTLTRRLRAAKAEATGLRGALLLLGSGTVLAGMAALAAILASKGDTTGAGTVGNAIGKTDKFPVLSQIMKSFDFAPKKGTGVYAEFKALLEKKITKAQAERWFEAHLAQVAAAGGPSDISTGATDPEAATKAAAGKHRGRAARSAARGTGATGLTADQQNALALTEARTPGAQLAALVQQRRLLAGKIAEIRRKLKTAKGAEADLLIADLTSLEQTDQDAFNKIKSIQAAAAAKARKAARDAAAAARKTARDYATAVATTALELKNTAMETTTVTKTRAAFRALIDYYKREARDTRLAEKTRAEYAAKAIAARKQMVAQIVKDQRAIAKATETRQLKELGVDKGTSISTLLQRIRDAASNKEQGLGDGSGTVGTPSVRALRDEAAQVTKALRGTYLDTNVSRNVLARIRVVLSGKLGQLNAEMRGKIQQLLTGLKGDLKGFDGFNLTAAERRRRFLDKRFADTYGTNRHPRRATASAAPQYHWHFEPRIEAVLNEPLSRALDRSFFKMRASLGHN